ncbi:hypothetical protein ACFOY8_12725 [Thalassospira xianhensis]|uniref:Riboflavin biosynthesis intermediates N-glycosidase n=1 Tax=Thalassospira xianhensis MCCC 1A02616 TaxID=1177929 RepID=A0A367UD87_9PROT|nr:hypothetical protein [Thalassospira xianhensis]RCK06286.1 hypothetical protein TH5_08710 [Thalassospira xianhensis MCCC 1A02616]
MLQMEALPIRKYCDDPYVEYSGRWVDNWFSNLKAIGAPVRFRGFETNTLEFAYVAAKNPEMSHAIQGGRVLTFAEAVFQAETAAEAKKMGLGVQSGRWKFTCLAAMDSFQRQRWAPVPGNEVWVQKLLDEAQAGPIIEWNNWSDLRWGVCVERSRGRNALGLLLSSIAQEIVETGELQQYPDEDTWPQRQAELIEKLSSMFPESLSAKDLAKTSQASLF